jgi:histidine triad (HIT) family protein
MYRHAPPDYVCPLCVLTAGGDNPSPHACQSDVVASTQYATAFIGARFWPHNRGPVVVVPNEHLENLFELREELAAHVHELARLAALAMKRAYACAGITTSQHNEPAGGQSVWHYHLHVIPRYPDDRYYEVVTDSRYTTPEERSPYAAQLRAELSRRN